MRCKEKNFTVGQASGVAFACACSLYINKKISVVKLQHFSGFGDGVRGAPAGLLCVSAWVVDGVRGA